MAARRGGRVFAAIIAAAVATALAVLPPLSALDPLSIDALFWLRRQVAPADEAPSPVAVVAFDEETYRRPPFAGTPSALWTPELARVVEALRVAGAKVIGLDIILPTSGQRASPGFDRPWLEALSAAGKEGRIVLGKVQHGTNPILPHPAQQIAVGGEHNIRAVNLASDADDVVRRVPLFFATTAGAPEPSFVLELAARALGAMPAVVEGGRVRIGAHAVPGRASEGLLVNFDAGGARPPVHSFADLAACSAPDRAAASTEHFRQHFAGKVVLIGAILDVEDRRLTSFRFATHAEEAKPAPRCVHPPMKELKSAGARDTIPGVLILAAAVENILQQTALTRSGGLTIVALISALALLATLAGAFLRPAAAVSAALVLAMALLAASVLLFTRAHLVLPLLPGGMSIALALLFAGGHRQLLAERERARLRQSFELFLPPEVVARLMAENRLPALGGEEREVTTLFADLAGFTARAEKLTPQQTVALVNRYFAIVAEEVERHGGIVDKFIGDAVLAVFGAPLALPDHAAAAAEAALGCRVRLAALNAGDPALKDDPLRQRIGLNTGRAVVGNVGSKRRLNYTVMGDAVNLAQRIQQANRGYGTDILASGATQQQSQARIAWRALATTTVPGRREQVALFELIGLKA